MDRSQSRHHYVAGAVLSRPLLTVDVLVGGMAVVAVLGLGLLVLPRLAFPLQDEVFYVGPTVWLAETGRLIVPTAILPSFISVAAWGAVFVKLFGGSFVTLRVASLAAGALAALVFYALLRHLGFDRVRSVLALAVLVLNPLYLSSSVLFLTEAFFVLLVLAALYTGLRGLQLGQGSLLLAAGLLAGGAFLTRQLGLCVAVALAVGLLATPRLRRSPRLWLMLLLPPALAVLAYLLWSSGPTGVASRGYFASSLQMWTHEVQVTHLARRLNWVLAYFGLFVSPLLLMYAPTLLRHLGRLDRRGKAVVSGSVLLVMIGYAYEWWKGIRHFPYLDITLDPRGLFMKGFTDEAQWPYEPWLVVGTLAMWAAAGAVLGLVVRALYRSRDRWWRHPHLPVYLTGALLALASISPRMPNDRYFLAWLPFALITGLAVTRSVRPSLILATGVLALAAVLNVALMVDYSQRAALRWEIARHLVESGIPAHDIAASWEWQWWWGYWQVYQVGDGLPGAAEPDPDAQDTASSLRMVERNFDRRRDVDRPYRISAVPEPGYAVEQAYSYWSPLGWQARPLYVLRAPSAQSHGTPTPAAGWASIAAVWSWHLTWPQSLRPGAS